MTLAVETPVASATEAAPNSVPSTPAEAPSEPGGDAPPKNRAERRALMNKSERMAKMLQATEARKASADPAPKLDAPPAEPAKVEPSPASAAPSLDAPPAPAAAPKDTDAALMRAIEQANRKEREAYEARQAAKAHEQRLKDLERQLAERDEADKKLKADPFKRRVAEGATYEQLTQEMVEGKLKPPTAEEIEREANKSELQKLQEKLTALETERAKEREEFEARQTAEREQAELTARATKLTAKLQEHAQHFPTLAAVPWGAAEVLRLHKANPEKSLDDVARYLEQRASTDVGHVLKHGPSARALITDEVLGSLIEDAGFRDRVAKLIAAKQPAPSASPASTPQGDPRARDVPDAIPPSRANDPGDRAKPAKARTTAERAARGLAAVEARRRASRG